MGDKGWDWELIEEDLFFLIYRCFKYYVFFITSAVLGPTEDTE